MITGQHTCGPQDTDGDTVHSGLSYNRCSCTLSFTTLSISLKKQNKTPLSQNEKKGNKDKTKSGKKW